MVESGKAGGNGLREIILLGCSLHTLPVTLDIAYESLGVREFRILKNIPVEGVLALGKCGDLYRCAIHEPDESFQVSRGTLFFGLVGPKGKYLVFSHFREKYRIDKSWFLNLLHPSSYMALSAELAAGILLEPGAIISSQTRIDFGVTIKRGASVGHHAVIEEYTEINPGAVICGGVHIGRGCTLGAGCVVRDGCSVGDNSLIGMGSVVTGDIPAGVIAYGNPCKVVRDNAAWEE